MQSLMIHVANDLKKLPDPSNIYPMIYKGLFPEYAAVDLFFGSIYSGCQKKTFRYSNVFSTTTYAPLPYIGTLLWKAV